MGVGRERLGKVGGKKEGRDRERGRERGRERKGMGSRERGEWKREGGLGREEMGRQRKGMARAAGRLGRDAERERERDLVMTGHLIIIVMYIYHALINAQSAHMIHINLNTIFYTHVEHQPKQLTYLRISAAISIRLLCVLRTAILTSDDCSWCVPAR